MPPPELLMAIRDEPDSDAPRHALADWLAAHGEPARAEWMRASLAAREYAERFDADRAFEHVRPAAWRKLSGIVERTSRGLVTLEVSARGGGAKALQRLGKAKWLREAFAAGWVECVAIPICEDAMAEVIAGWSGVAAQLPLRVWAAPQMTSTGLAALAAARVERLVLPERALGWATLSPLASFSSLRSLAVELRNVPGFADHAARDAATDRLFEIVGALAELRSLALEGPRFPNQGGRPTDDDLLALRTMRSLRRLTLTHCFTLTPDGVRALAAARPDLEVAELGRPAA